MQTGKQARSIAGGAKQWVAGPQKEGTLVFNAGFVYRVKQDIADGQAAPTATNAFYLKLPVYNDPRLTGLTDDDPAAPRSVTNALTTRLDFIRRSVIRYYDPIARVTNDLVDTTLKYESGGSYVLTKGSYDALMELSPVGSQQARQGDVIGIRVTAGTPDFTLKPTPLQAFGSPNGPKAFTAIAGWQYEFHAVLPSGSGTQNSYWVVHSTPSTGTPGTGTAYQHGQTTATGGAQTIPVEGASFFMQVGVLGRNSAGKLVTLDTLSYPEGYTFSAGQLQILSDASVPQGALIKWVSDAAGSGGGVAPTISDFTVTSL